MDINWVTIRTVQDRDTPLVPPEWYPPDEGPLCSQRRLPARARDLGGEEQETPLNERFQEPVVRKGTTERDRC